MLAAVEFGETKDNGAVETSSGFIGGPWVFHPLNVQTFSSLLSFSVFPVIICSLVFLFSFINFAEKLKFKCFVIFKYKIKILNSKKSKVKR